jgi:hypothetical protein
MLKKVALSVAFLFTLASPSFSQAVTATESVTVTVGGLVINVPFTDLVIDNVPPLNLPNKALGDINKDGRMDVVAAESCITGGGMYWYENPGNNGWNRSQSLILGGAVY